MSSEFSALQMNLPAPIDELRLATARIGRRMLVYDELPSTMAVCAELARNSRNDGVAVIAGVQTSGRGQYGRSWIAPRGASVLLGIVLFPPPHARRPAILTAWAAVSVAETIQRLTGLAARIKWPNDIIIHRKKVSGILIETHAGSVPSVIVGIGLNVNQSAEEFSAAGLPGATSITLCTGRLFDINAVAGTMLEELDKQYSSIVQGDLATLQSSWTQRVGLQGRRVIAERADCVTHVGQLVEQSFESIQFACEDGTQLRLLPEAIRRLTPAPSGT